MKTINQLYEAKLNEAYGTEHLEDQNAELGALVKDLKDVKVGKTYCIVDLGLEEWNSGYKLKAIKGNMYIFDDLLGSPLDKEVFEFTRGDILELIYDKAIAFEK
ncbi:gp153 [Sphingomonas phage PAU]|uniref:gp153 n=1 Tax=Sphingomonas phage PAU TaxID=1150991 RepID=UPI00025732E5|nr:gp153 [Sphingomonas phage PAU]AFF28151.1 gp153 [Sphingomonas phage PAU]